MAEISAVMFPSRNWDIGASPRRGGNMGNIWPLSARRGVQSRAIARNPPRERDTSRPFMPGFWAPPTRHPPRPCTAHCRKLMGRSEGASDLYVYAAIVPGEELRIARRDPLLRHAFPVIRYQLPVVWQPAIGGSRDRDGCGPDAFRGPS